MSHEKNLRKVIEDYYHQNCFRQKNIETSLYYKNLVTFKEPMMRFTQEFLYPDEVVESFLNIVSFLWATNKRLIWVGSETKNILSRPEPLYREFSYNSIASVQSEKGRFLGMHKIVFHISTTSASGYVRPEVFETSADYSLVERFAGHVKARIAALNQKVVDKPQSTSTNNDELIAQLERLANLRSQGAITEEEFKAAKMKLLGM